MRKEPQKKNFQRYTTDQQANGKLLNITSHQRNANQGHNEVLYHC